MSADAPLLQVRNLGVRFETRDGPLRAVDAVSFELEAGETLGIVGESGCGKSTLGRAVLGLVPAMQGEVLWLGRNLAELGRRERRPWRRELQVVFQDPAASLDPRLRVGATLEEPLQLHSPELGPAERRSRVADMLERVGLGETFAQRYPHELSGGQCQRVAIARAMILRPRLVICDEPVSALDVSIQGQIVNLLRELQQASGVAYLFISHNLAVVRQLGQRLLVMYLGRVVEEGSAAEVLASARHPYTRALLAALPDPGRPDWLATRTRLAGDLPSPLAPPGGCAFHPRCPHAAVRCRSTPPALEPVATGRSVACHRWREL